MKTLILICTAAALAAAAVCSAGDDPVARARSLRQIEPAYGTPELVVLKSLPPQFQLAFEPDMPTPGWKIAVDSVELDEAGGRIVARCTEVGPTGITAQVVTKTRVRIELGTLQPGHYIFELWTRRGTDRPYHPAQTFVLVAS